MGIEADNQSQDGADAGDSTLGLELALQRAAGGHGRDAVADALLSTQTEKLRHELHHLKLRGINEWFAILLKALGLLVGTAVVAAVAWMAIDAARGHALVVEPFHVPPDLVEKGLDGGVLAAAVLDKLGEMRADTVSARANSGYSGETAAETKLEIPDTGVSVSELQHLLHEWLGHDTMISGNVVHVGDTLALTVRTGGVAKTFTAPPAEMDHLIAQAAEAIFAASQPLSFTEYLGEHGRNDESIVLAKRLTSTGSRHDRAWAYLELGTGLRAARDAAGAEHAYDEAASLNPDLWLVWENKADLAAFGEANEERALAFRRRAVAATDFGDADPNVAAHFHLDDQVFVDEYGGDFSAALAAVAKEAEEQGDNSLAYQSAYLAAYEAAYLHDDATMRQWSQRAQDHGFALREYDVRVRGPERLAHRLRYWQLAIVDDWDGAAREMAAAIATGGPGADMPYWRALEAIALARAGHPKEAGTVLHAAQGSCYFCVLAEGWIAEAAGDRAAADRFFSNTARHYPSLARGREYWGQVKLVRGDTKGAIQVFAAVNAIGPHFADPLEGWGEALMRTGDFSGAIEKFAAADKYDPNWGRNHLRWGQALAKLGRGDEARAQFAKAGTLALSPADRASLPR